MSQFQVLQALAGIPIVHLSDPNKFCIVHTSESLYEYPHVSPQVEVKMRWRGLGLWDSPTGASAGRVKAMGNPWMCWRFSTQVDNLSQSQHRGTHSVELQGNDNEPNAIGVPRGPELNGAVRKVCPGKDEDDRSAVKT
ncbi:hypothetical protein C8F01DRAFT_1083162 [Mycena amicta]|nr:hypothetical protein C8F01DRAFT_1083162 [Mycena amicta]